MPKCSKCGKSFSSLQALNDHFRSVHPNERFVPPKQVSSARTLITIIIIVIIVMGSLVGFLIYNSISNSHSSTSYTVDTSSVGQPASPSLTQVSQAMLSQIGSGSGASPLTTIPSSNTNGSMTNNGKPEILYIGGDFCPYCAAERWALVIALEQFGNFSGLTLMQSSATDVYPSTSTFSFANATYTSQYVSFVAVEHYGASSTAVYQPLTSSQQTVWGTYDSQGSIPFVDIYNRYTNGNSGSQYEPYILHVGQTAASSGRPYNWTEISTQLSNSSNLISKAVLGSANYLISNICSVIAQSGQSAPSVCSQSFAKLAIIPGVSEGSPILSVTVPAKLELPF